MAEIASHDVAVIGGGPAGLAAACSLAVAGKRVVVLTEEPRPRAYVETVPPEAKVVLGRLGVATNAFSESAPIHSSASAWGSAELLEHESLRNPHGPGWRIDRAELNEALAARVADLGVRLVHGRFVGCDRTASGWLARCRTRAGSECGAIAVTFLVDATGRAANVGRACGARILAVDKLAGIVGEVSVSSAGPVTPLVEACEDGYWFSIPKGPTSILAVYFTDADMGVSAAPRSIWTRALEPSRHTRARVVGGELAASVTVVNARSQRLDVIGGEGWAAIGDAAFATDPLSSGGVYEALRAGAELSLLHADAYRQTASERFRRYLTKRAAFYASERRWPGSLFWRRRCAASSFDQPETAT